MSEVIAPVEVSRPLEHGTGEPVMIGKLEMIPVELKMIPVESSNVAAIGYSPGPNGKPGNCYVDFRSGARYCYADVPAETWQQFLDTPSKGTFVMRVLRDTYDYFKVER